MIRDILLLTAAACIAATPGCKKSEPTAPETTSGGGGIVTPDQRTAVFSAIDHAMDSIPWTSVWSGNRMLAAYLKVRPEFASVGVNDSAGNVWAVFNDGRTLIIAENRPTNGDTLAIFPGAKGLLQTPDAPIELPGSKNAILINSMGSHFVDPVPALTSMLSSRGYMVQSNKGRISDFLNVGPAGILYINAHGGLSGADIHDSTTYFAGIWTSDVRTPELDEGYKQFFDAGELVYFTARNGRTPGFIGPNDPGVLETHYGITRRFIQNHIKLSQNELVYVDACYSHSAALSGGFKTQPVTYVGWSNWVDANGAYNVMKFVFDRLLGTNITYLSNPPRENPPQRPFTIDKIWQDMQARGINKVSGSDPDDPGGNIHIATLEYDQGGNFGILAPSIEKMTVIEKSGANDELHIFGIFGTKQGAVTVNGAPVSLASGGWSRGEITCLIPHSGSTAAGNVVVDVDGHTSNTVQLTEWNGIVDAYLNSFGSLQIHWQFNLHLRADLHSFRDLPNKAPKPQASINTTCAADSKGQVNASGTGPASASVNGCTFSQTESWVQAGDSTLRPAGGGFAGPNTFAVAATFEPGTKKLHIDIDASALSVFKASADLHADCPGGNPYDSHVDGPPTGADLGFHGIEMQLDDAFNISAGKKDTSLLGVFEIPWVQLDPWPTFSCPVIWGQINAHYPPDKNAAQEIKPEAIVSSFK